MKDQECFLSDHSHRSEAGANQSSDIRANGNAITRSHPQCERVVPLFVANPVTPPNKYANAVFLLEIYQ